MEGKLSNSLEIGNEILLLFSVWLMFIFSDFVEDPQIRYDFGYYFMYFIAAGIGLNLCIFATGVVTATWRQAS